MDGYHVLAKITAQTPQPGMSGAVEQRHFFVKAACESKALAVAELCVPCQDRSEIQFTVKKAQNHGRSSMEPGEEIYSL